MASLNKVILIGNMTRDPEHRVTASGHSICKFGLAVSRKYSTRDGEQREETTFVDIDAFGKQADTINQYMKKGSPIMVKGRLKLDQWETDDGQKRSKLGVIVENFQFLPSGQRSSEGRGSNDRPASSPSRAPAAPAGHDEGDFDENIPF
jgi:single-strand DNA-binding protein